MILSYFCEMSHIVAGSVEVNFRRLKLFSGSNIANLNVNFYMHGKSRVKSCFKPFNFEKIRKVYILGIDYNTSVHKNNLF
jgi:hypothetical protein